VRRLFNRPIGQILLDGRFLSRESLGCALDEQKRTHELLGQVLVRMGLLKPHEISAPLLVQGHLNHIEDAVKIAAGERQLLGALLVNSGRITGVQLDQAIAEQKRSGEKLGEVLTRLGMLTERQLQALLDFQQCQSLPSDSPLRLGELLVATGHISREQLDAALRKQSQTGGKLGEVLVAEGYARPNQVKRGVRLQKMLVNSVLAAILSLSMSSVSSATSVQLQWDQNTDSDLAGYKVYYAAESSSFEGVTPIDVHKQTMATIDGLDPDKSYSFTVTAYNSEGQESGFSNVVAVPELSPPTVAITSPSDSAVVSGAVSITVDASDNVGVAKVEFYVNGELKVSDATSPYLYTWDTSSLASGSYTLVAKAYDAAGNVSQSSRTVNVVNDTIAPTVSMASPTTSAVVSGVIPIKANAADNVGVSMVEIYANGVLLFAANTSPYSFFWDTRLVANGVYNLTARAYDSAGNINSSTAVTVTVNNPVPDSVAPTLSAFSMPSASTSLTVPVSSFTASDNVGVTGYLISESASAPSAGASGWSSSAPTSFTFSGGGAKTAYAWVRDAAGNVSSSKTARVTITLPDTAAPVITFSAPTSSTITASRLIIAASAKDNVKVTKMELYLDGILRLTTTSRSIKTSIKVAPGSHTIQVKAYDGANNVSTASKTVATGSRKVSGITPAG